MTDMLRAGLDWLDSVRNEHMTCTVTFARGESTVQVSATVGKTEYSQTDEYGIERRFETRDFLIRTADLQLDEKAVLPSVGDRITQTEGDKDYVYEVLSPGGEPHYRYCDPYMKTLRIHTKLVGEE